jgi:hypothetical protein
MPDTRRELQEIAWHSHTNALDGIVYTTGLGWVQEEKVLCMLWGGYLDGKGLAWPADFADERRSIGEICDVEESATWTLVERGIPVPSGSFMRGIRERLVLLGTCWLARFRLGA